ncbi:hypothetical protein ACNQ21_00340 [Mycoplasma sp. VS299A]|uniref:hypothetical protein n=1 Tax=Mycoplasma sp. VS299A TaxID=3401690 RepID=UPI003AAA5DB0
MENYQDIEALKSNLDDILNERENLIQNALNNLENDYKDSLSSEELSAAKEWIKSLNSISAIKKDMLLNDIEEGFINEELKDAIEAKFYNYSLDDIAEEFNEDMLDYEKYSTNFFDNWIHNIDWKDFAETNIKYDFDWIYLNDVELFYTLSQINNISLEEGNQIIQDLKEKYDIEALKSNLDDILNERENLIQNALNNLENDYKDSLSSEELSAAKEWIKSLKDFNNLDVEILKGTLQDTENAKFYHYSTEDIKDNYGDFMDNYDAYNSILYEKYIENGQNDAETFEYSNIRDDLNFLYINDIQCLYLLNLIKDVSNDKYYETLKDLNISTDILSIDEEYASSLMK